MRARALQLAILALAITACQSRQADDSDPTAATKAAQEATAEPAAAAAPDQGAADPTGVDGPASGDGIDLLDGDLIIAGQGPLTVTMDDFMYAIAWREWMNGGAIEARFGEDWLDDNETLGSLVLPLLGEALLRTDAARFDVTVSDEAITEALQTNPVSRDFMAVPEEIRDIELARLGLTNDRMRLYAADPLLLQAWIDHRVSMITDDDRWAAYERRNSLVSMTAVTVPNVHSAAVVDEFIANRGDEITARYHIRSHNFLMPRRARSRVVRLPFGDDEDATQTMIEALRTRALEEGTQAVVSFSNEPSALTGDGTQWVTDRELPAAFDVPVGEIGPVTRDNRGFYFVENFEIRGRELRPLDDRLRQEIARAILREAGPSAESMVRADRIMDGFREDREAAVLAEERLSSDEIPLFARTQLGIVPHIGQAPELVEAAFSDGVEAGTLIGPLHVYAGIIVARVTERTVVTRAQYEAERETFDVEFEAYIRANAWPARRAEFDAAQRPSVNLPRIRAAYAARMAAAAQ